MPALIERYQVANIGASSYPGPAAGTRGFDPWCLTSARERKGWRQDPRARQAIKELWDYDPDPSATLRIQTEIDAALGDGAIGYGKERSGNFLGAYYSCPWGAVYQVVRPVVLGRKRLRPGQQFTYGVCADEIADGGAFTREIIVGNFSPTNEVDYCDPDGLHEG